MPGHFFFLRRPASFCDAMSSAGVSGINKGAHALGVAFDYRTLDEIQEPTRTVSVMRWCSKKSRMS